jgi:beta-catenin-like protein 1
LVSNLGRLDEKEDADRQGVFQTLGIFENLLSFMPPLAEQIGESTSFLDWLLRRIREEDFDSNKQYAAEVLSILLQSSHSNVSKVAAAEGIDALLLVLSVCYRFCRRY